MIKSIIISIILTVLTSNSAKAYVGTPAQTGQVLGEQTTGIPSIYLYLAIFAILLIFGALFLFKKVSNK